MASTQIMPAPRKILIAGGGPAGATCGERLARAGCAVTIFEERRGWEKPCGGGVTWKTLERYPYLLDGGVEKKLIRSVELIAGNGARVRLALSRPLAIYSRAALNSFLLRRAEAAGCTVVPARALSARTDVTGARLRTAGGEFAGDFLVIATGARTTLSFEHRAGGNGGEQAWPPGPGDLELTLGYYLPIQDDLLRVQFLENFEGYLWSFPRADHLAVGICGKLAQNSSAGLKEKLHRFLAAESIPLRGGAFYSHLLPSLERPTWKRLPLGGPAEARIGDAAGLVDPITGEGIYYALRSGELLAEALIHADARSYAARVEEDFARELRCAAAWQPAFYRGRWLGVNTTGRMIQLGRRSARFRELLDDLFAGAQSYRGVKWRLARLALPGAFDRVTSRRNRKALFRPSGAARLGPSTSPLDGARDRLRASSGQGSRWTDQ
ncbi:MAG: NAD(P)/FAD-dependent oxidoreductase [Terriglobia bacterium]